jgi:hypothetical protein
MIQNIKELSEAEVRRVLAILIADANENRRTRDQVKQNERDIRALRRANATG